MRALVILASFVLLLPLTLSGQTRISGELGVDSENYQFKSEYTDISNDASTNRTRSGHYLRMLSSGTIVNNHFGNYMARATVRGTYFSSKSEINRVTEYISPTIRSYYLQTTLLPEKRFPIKLYRSNSDVYSLRYEPNNRTDRELQQPELGVVRRYRTEKNVTGGSIQYAPREGINISTEIKQDELVSTRIYDFGENLDIWRAITRIPGRLNDSSFFVDFENTLDSSVTIQIIHLDSLEQQGNPMTIVIQDLPPGGRIMDTVAIGRIEISIDADGFNRLVLEINATDNLLVRILYLDPAAPNDLSQTANVVTTQIEVKNGEKFSSKAFFEYSDQHEDVQQQTTFLSNFSNDARYKFSDRWDMMFNTTYQGNKQIVTNQSSQVANAFAHRSTINYGKRRGINASLNHSIGLNTSKVFPDTINSTLNQLDGRLLIPSRWHNNKADFRVTTSFLSDNTEYVSNQYSVVAGDRLRFNFWSSSFEPDARVQYAVTHQENPNQNTTELQPQIALTVKPPESRFFGTVRMRGRLRYRHRIDDKGTDIQTEYLFNGTLIRKFGDMWRVNVLVLQEYNTYGGSSANPETNIAQAISTKEAELQSGYKLGFQMTPSPTVLLTGDYMIITQRGTDLQRYSASASFIIPKIRLPLKSTLIGETRKIQALSKQSTLAIETKTLYQIRQITISLKHAYREEVQLFEKYKVHEIVAKVTRQFTIK